MQVRLPDLVEMAPVPVDADDAVDEQLLPGADALHRLLDLHRVRHGAVERALRHEQQRVLHVAAELLAQHVDERDVVLGLVRVGERAQLPVRARRQHVAHGDLVRADLALGRAVQVGAVAVQVRRDDGRRLLGAVRRHDHAEEARRLGREVVFDVRLHAAVEGELVGVLDRGHVGVAAGEEDVVEDRLLCADAFDGFVDVVDLQGNVVY